MKRYIRSAVVNISDESDDIKRSVAMYPSTDADTLTALSKDPSPKVRLFVAYNTHTPTDALISLVNDSDSSVRQKALANPRLPTEELAKAVDERGGWELDICGVAENPNCPASILDALAHKSRLEGVLLRIAKHHNVSEDTLLYLSTNYSDAVRYSVVSNANTPLYIIEHMIDDSTDVVRRCIAMDPRISAESLVRLSEDSDVSVVEEVARNPNTPTFVLDRLVDYDNYMVRETARYVLRERRDNDH